MKYGVTSEATIEDIESSAQISTMIDVQFSTNLKEKWQNDP